MAKKIEDDPTYNQPKPALSGSSSSKFESSETAGEAIASDPVYNQPQSDHSSTGSRPIANDPVYSQPGSDSPGVPTTKVPSSKKPVVADDPVYNQPQTKSNGTKSASTTSTSIANDPVYNQPKHTPASGEDADYASSSTQLDSNPSVSTSTQADFSQTKAVHVPEASSEDHPQGQEITMHSTYNLQDPKSTASQRLSQLTSHIAPTPTESQANTSRPRRAKKPRPKDHQSALPSDYSDILTHLTTMRAHAANPPANSRGHIRQKAAGKMLARERIALLLDAGSFREIGSVTGSTTWRTDKDNPLLEHIDDFTPSNNPQGFGRLTLLRTGNTNLTRQVYLTSDDFAIRGGHADGHNALKTLYGEKLALRLKVPVVKLVDGSSGGGSVTTIAKTGFSYIPHVTVLSTVVKQLNEGIPNLGCVVGPAIGLGAARVVCTHFSVMARDVGSLFNAGPKVVEGATFEEGLSFEELGGPGVHCANGTIDNMAEDERGCYEQVKTVLGYLPNWGRGQAPPCLEEGWSGDSVEREDVGLRTVVPRKKNRMYNPYTIVESVVDRGSWFEIGGLWGRTGIVGLARLGGRPVAILSNNCEVNGGALDAQGSQKLLKMIKFADIFNLPIVQFVDVPGYAIGTVAERSGVMKWGVELAKAYYTSTTPIFTVLTRRAFGVAGGVMLDSREPWMRIAWPSSNWGSLPLDGGIEVGHRHELKTIREKAEQEKPGSGEEAFKKRYQELDEMYSRLMNPVRTANVFNIEEIVDPKDTRRICCRWTKEMYGVPMQERLADRAAGRINPVFA